MHVVVVGGTGIISSGIVKALLQFGHKVTVYNRGLRVPPEQLPHGVRFLQGDRKQRADFEAAMQAQHFDAAIDMLCFNAEDAASDVRAFRGVRHFIQTSTISTFGGPLAELPTSETSPLLPDSDYGRNKMAADNLFLAAHERGELAVTIFKPHYIWGPGMSICRQIAHDKRWIDRMRRDMPLIVTAGGQLLMTHCHSDDCGIAFAAAVGRARCLGQVYLLTGPNHITWAEYHRQIAAALGRKVTLVDAPAELLLKVWPENTKQLASESRWNRIFKLDKIRARHPGVPAQDYDGAGCGRLHSLDGRAWPGLGCTGRRHRGSHHRRCRQAVGRFQCAALIVTTSPIGGPMPEQAHETTEALPGEIIYARPGIAPVADKPYTGTTYRDRVPDTYDIAQRAGLAVNGVTGPTNPLADYELYWLVAYNRNPVVMYHDWSDWCQFKFMEALPLLRIASGSKQNVQVDAIWREVTLKSIGPDGLFYTPLAGRPWARTGVAWANSVARADGTFTSHDDPTVTQVTHPYACGRMMGTMLVYYLRDGDPLWLEMIKKMVDRLAELAVDKDDYCFFPVLSYEPNASYDKNSPQAAMPLHITGGEINSRVPESLAKFYKLTGYEPARVLAEKLVRYTRFHMDYYGADGEFLGEKHFHGHTIYLLSMLELAIATGDKELVEFVRKSYEWAKTAAAGASDLVGFFPELAKPDYLSCEACEIADMIALALRLTDAGAGDFYADAERWTQNHFAESQLTNYQWLYDQAGKWPAKPVAYNETAFHTPERNIGAFAGWSAGNDWWTQGPGIMHCCTGNATRSLYYLWHDILRYKDGQLRINMLLNRASPWADVYSYVPYTGQVDVKIKQSCRDLLIHAPEWIKTGSTGMVATVDGVSALSHWQDRYISLGPLTAGQTVSVTFPIAERTVKETMGTVEYTLVVKGNTVVHIDPPGKNFPLYQRDHYRSGQVRWNDVERFVSDENVSY